MLFKGRVHCIAKVASADELAEKLTKHDWTTCTAFLLGDVLYANDSTGPDGAQEYGVVEVSSVGDGVLVGTQFESITFGWIDSQEEARKLIENFADAGEREKLKASFGAAVAMPLHAASETCGSCA